jgi:hypothetical protein
VAPEQVAGDRAALDLVGPLEDAQQPDVAVEALDRQFAGVAHAAVDLHDPVDDLVGLHPAEELGDGLRVARVPPHRHLPGGVQDEQAQGLDLGLGVGDHPLDGLAVGDGRPERLAGPGVLDRHVQQALAPAERAGGQQVAALADPLHGEGEPVPLLAQDVLMGHAHVLEDQGGGAALAHGVDGLGGPARVAVDEEAGHAPVGALLRVGDREDHGEVGLVAACDEGLLAVDHPLVAVADRAGADGLGVGARAGLGDGEAGAALTGDRGQEVALLLLLVGVVQDVVGLAAELEGQEGSAQFDLDDRRGDRVQAHAAVLGRRLHAPEVGLAGQLAQAGALLGVQAGRAALALAAQHLVLQRHELPLDEGPHPVAYGALFFAQREIDHGLLPSNLTVFGYLRVRCARPCVQEVAASGFPRVPAAGRRGPAPPRQRPADTAGTRRRTCAAY